MASPPSSRATSLVNVNDRIEEYRRDWDAADAGPRKKKRIPKAARPVQMASFAMLAVCSFLVGSHKLVDHWRRQMQNATQREINRVKTQLEMSMQLRLLRQYYLANGALPKDPMGYLKPFMKDNKPYPRGSDFWGHPYRVDSDHDAFGVRSAGPNGKMDDRDDLLASVKVKAITNKL